MENDSAHSDNVRTRFDTFRSWFRTSVQTNFFQGVVNVVLAGGLVWTVTHPAQPPVIATDITGRVTQLVPITEPIMTEPALMDWTTNVIRGTCSLGWAYYQDQLFGPNGVRRSFTDAGWAGVEAQLASPQGVIKRLTGDRLDMTCDNTKPARIRKKEIVNSRLVYQITVPFHVIYRGQNTDLDREQSGTYVATVTRVDLNAQPPGYAIFALTFSPGQMTVGEGP